MQASEHVDLVVLGRRGHGPSRGLLVGRTVDRMLRIGRRPVLVVATSVHGTYRRVLVPIDFTASSDAAIRVADRMRREERHACVSTPSTLGERLLLRDADVPEHVIRGVAPDGRRRGQRSHASQGLQTRPGRRVHELCAGVRSPGAIDPASRPQARCRPHRRRETGRSTLGNFLLGSVSSRVLSEASCDMLIVPRPLDSVLRHRLRRRSRASTELGRYIDNAALARSAAAHAGALTHGHWIHNKARFVSRDRHEADANAVDRPVGHAAAEESPDRMVRLRMGRARTAS